MKRLSSVGGNFAVIYLYGFVGFSKINLTVMSKIAVVMKCGNALAVVANLTTLNRQSWE